ncbi:MAG TPA: DNA polymerase I [Bryobacteraceae bacterium]|nr:DNA polymerase I [Bryobacteraceae bacterium]
MKTDNKPPRLFLIDSFGFIFRAFHARARTGAPPMRTTTGISTEATFIFNNMLRKLTRTYEPAYMAAVFESLGKTHRETEYAEYKANRAETPDDLLQQIPWVRRLIEALRIPIIESEGFEADDVIGTLSRKAAAAGFDVVIVSSDKDLLQLVTDRVHMMNPAKDDTWYDPAKVEEFMGVPPKNVADLLALKGDAVDNIPGAPGIGDKGAKDLVAQFGSVEAALDRASEVTKKMYRESLQNNRERIELSKRLATIDCNVPIEFEAEKFRMQEPDPALLKPLLKELEFFSHLKEYTESLGVAEDTRPRDFATLATADETAAWLAARPADKTLSFSFSSDCGEIGMSWQESEARAVPVSRVSELRETLENPAVPKSAADLKNFQRTLLGLQIEPAGFGDDPSLYSFMLDADPGSCSLDAMVERRLELKPGPRADERACFTHELTELLRPEIQRRESMLPLYRDVELPLAGVLARMEYTGIRVNSEALESLSAMLETQIGALTTDIHKAAGREFNIASPQQLAKVLFEELGIPTPVRYGKGKVPSTAADVLEALAPDHAIVRQVLEYRQLTKLKGTYADALPMLIDPMTGRIHTSFSQTGAATGRLSSSNPNLQNIPIRTELGRQIRAAFVPREGWTLIVADYSQIELRLLAHMSEDPVLVDAFQRGDDIHTRTAAEVMGVPPMMVTKEARNAAKAVNFGIVYGISGFGLAANLGIPRKEAEAYIKSYFERYSGVKKFIDAAVAQTRQTGIAKTLLGRERPIPDINSRNSTARGFAERTAMNTPIQGTAADLIKLAMVRIDRKLRGRHAKLLLQVHDELVLEAPPEELEEIKGLVKAEMEGVMKLNVPLVADVGTGDNWRDAK